MYTGVEDTVLEDIENDRRVVGIDMQKAREELLLSNDELTYVGGTRLNSIPKVIFISSGASLDEDLYEYKDAEKIKELNNKLREKGSLNFFEVSKLKKLKEKYGLVDSYNI